MKVLSLVLAMSIAMGHITTYAQSAPVETQAQMVRKMRAKDALQRLFVLQVQEAALVDYEKDPYHGYKAGAGGAAFGAVLGLWGSSMLLTINHPRMSLKWGLAIMGATAAGVGALGYKAMQGSEKYGEMTDRVSDMSAQDRENLRGELTNKIEETNNEIQAINAEDEAEGLN